ncbi:alkyl sulfatase C-terminal domain-containing protein [Mycolicibacterium elephantis]|uniref:alkyl sulfatase C-terminal domain-containing protein n=1 Tax=Mycolicibacterium elephantis TaxID=81858 RepID=UPI000E743DB1|nr:alkyl sulfatase C-terminal domain-containing protein [Mycolicibacterium elephantis]
MDGQQESLNEFIGLLDTFPFWFNIVTPDRASTRATMPTAIQGTAAGRWPARRSLRPG